MAKKIRIGINFTHNDNWIGGTYYIVNLIASLNTLEENNKPEIVVLSWHYSDFELIGQAGYPHVSFLDLSFPLNPFERVVNKLSKVFLGRVIVEKFLSDKQIDVMFPCHISPRFDKVSKGIFWIPDFQEIHYPDFFLAEEINSRKEFYAKVVASGKSIVFSSRHAIGDFQKLYPGAKNKTFVLNFAVTHPEYDSLDIGQLRSKYGITKKYFIAPNQFWAHKNQVVILKALCLLKDRNDFHVVFTGQESDYRNPDFFNSLKKFVSDNSLDDKVRFLGFIDRRDQLKLMSESLAIIQPSLFEGWSTVVEDAKAMNKFILLSDIPVHREQISGNCTFFNPNDEALLASEMKNILLNGMQQETKIDYSANIKEFANDFINIINQEL